MRRFWKSVAILTSLLTCATAGAADKSGVSPDRVRLPKGPGSLEGIGENAEPNLSMGVLGYGVPIELPQGYEGATPALRLSYASSAGNGEVGMGWSLPVPSIERQTVKGLPRYDRTDTFVSSGSEELVRVDAQTGVYRARFEGAFVRYRWHDESRDGRGGYWTAEYPDGRIGYFGATSSGAIVESARVGSAAGVFRYQLVELSDRLGHRVRYEYEKSGGHALLSRVSYVHRGESARYEVLMRYEARGDVLSDAKPGFELRLERRLAGIVVRARGEQLRRYALQYETDSESPRLSRLARVLRYGLNDEGPFPIVFSFAYSGGFGDSDPQVVTMAGSLGIGFEAGTAELLDINGDALPDVVDTAQAKHRFFVNELGATVHGFMAAQTSLFGSASMASARVQLVDVNGDGFTDLLNGNTKTILVNRGGGDWDEALAPRAFDFPNLESDANARFFDFDNDKRIDLLHADGSSTWVYENQGDGRFEQVLDVDAIDAAFSAGLELADLNGDGLQDLVRMTDGLVAYRMSLGRGRFAPWLEMDGAPERMPLEPRFVDLDGDSLADLVSVQGHTVLYALNEAGHGFAPLASIAASSELPIPERTSDVSVRYADMNGSGSTDVVWIDASGRARYLELFPERGNLLTHIENGLGKVIEASYGSAAAQMARDGGPATWKYRVPLPMLTLERLDTWDEHSRVHQEQTLIYRNGYYDGEERQFRGFEDVLVETAGDESSEAGQKTYRFEVGAQDVYRRALLLRQTSESAGRLLNTTENRYEDCRLTGVPALTPAVRHVCLTRTTRTVQEGADRAAWATIEEQYAYDGHGNRTRTARLGVTKVGGGGCAPCERAASVFGEPCGATCQGDEVYEEASFIAPGGAAAPWILDRPFRKRSYGQAKDGRIREEELYYDGEAFVGEPLGQLTRGLLSRVDSFHEAGEGGRIHKQRLAHDEQGAVVAVLDPNGHRRTYQYDEDSLLPEVEAVHFDDAVHEPYRLEVRVDYHPVLDLVVRSDDWVRVDASGQSEAPDTHYAYDAFGRLTRVAQPGDTLESPTEEYDYVLASPLSRIVRRGRSVAGAPTDVAEVQCFDGLGRKVQTRTRVEGDTFQISGYASFNAAGREVYSYQPHLGKGEKCALIEPAGVLATRARYDAEGRVVEAELADEAIYGSASVTRTAYAPLRTIVSDVEDTDRASPHHATPTTNIVDGLGRAVRVERELVAGTKVPMQFTYDDLGNLRGYVDARGNEKIQTFDLLGRLREVRDPDAGTLTYVYDAAGNLLSRTDARGETVVHAYDEADRPIADWSAASPVATQVRRDYDRLDGCSDCTHLAGRLAQITFPVDDDVGRDEFGYDARGRAVFLARTLDGHRFAFDSEFDNLGRLRAARSSLGIDFQYAYDAAGRLTGAPAHVDQLRYDARGSLSSTTFANGAVTRYEYDASARLRTLSTNDLAGTALQAYEYAYDRAGNVVSVTDASEGLSGFGSEGARYAYDAWYRLLSATLEPDADAPEELSYSYDEIDNILGKTSTRSSSPEHVGSYRYGEHGAGPHAVTLAGSSALTYDAAGNVLTQGAERFTWDAEGRLVAAHAGKEELGRYAYGPGLERVKKVEGGHTSYYITPDFEVRDGTAIGYLTVRGRRVARVENRAYAANVLHDLAPARQHEKTLESRPDGRVDAADAWLAHAARSELVHIDGAPRLEEQAAADILAASARRNAAEGSNAHGAELAVTFLHENHLGSLAVATDERGEVVERAVSYPYGADRDQALSGLDYGYTGKETDALTGLTYFGARYYMPQLGRWMSPDPFFIDSSDRTQGDPLEAANPYAFVTNRPIDMVDPDGQDAVLQRARDEGRGAHVNVIIANAKGRTSVDYASWKWIEMSNDGKSFKEERMLAAGEHTGAVSVRHGGLVHGAATHDQVRLKTSAQQDARLLSLAKQLEKGGGREINWTEKSIPYREASKNYHLLNNSCLDVSIGLVLDFVAGEARTEKDLATIGGIRNELAQQNSYDPASKFSVMVRHGQELQQIVDGAR